MKGAAIVIFVVIALALCLPAGAVDMEERFGVPEVGAALPEGAKSALSDWEASDGVESGIGKIVAYVRDGAQSIIGGLMRPVCAMIAVTLMLSAFDATVLGKRNFDYVNLAACLAIAVIGVGDVNSLIFLGRTTMAELSDFSKALLPTMCAAASAAGAVSSAPVKYAATALFLDVLLNAANVIIFPLVCAYCASVIANAALGDGRLKGVVKLLRWGCKIMLTALVTAFTLYLTVTGVIASSTDALATKAAKTAISAALPVVGSIVADAAGSIVAGAGVIRGALGVFGLIAVLAVCATPFLMLGVRYLLFKAAAALSCMIAGDNVSSLIDGIADACGMILGIVGVQALFIFISVISLIKAVGM